MICVGFLIFFILNCGLSCEGQVFPPSNQSMIVVLPGSTPRLKWTFQGDASRATLFWYFTKRGTSNEEDVAIKVLTQPVVIRNSSLPRVAIEDTATLVLNNVDERYNGKYRFSAVVAGAGGNAEVDLFIAAQPNPIINCSDATTVNENTDLACSCRDVAGNPPARLTWFDKDDVLIGNTSYVENILILTNVTKKDSGRYTCKAQSYTLKAETSFELIVHFRPNKTDIAFTSNPAFVNQKLTVTCDSNGLPKPTYTIMLDGNDVSNRNTHVINKVKMTDAGTYKCVAKNKLGSHSDSKNLTVAKVPTPKGPSHKITNTVFAYNTTGKTSSNCTNYTNYRTEWYIVVVTLVSGIIVGLFLAFIVWRFRCRLLFSNKNLERNPDREPKMTEVDTTYQELDLTKMNTEDNYQSLTVNAASNDAGNEDESTYTELSKTRDVEDKEHYQSLT